MIHAPNLPSTESIQTAAKHQLFQRQTGQQQDVPSKNNPTFICNVEGCRAKPFGRDAELQRHQKQKHNTLPPQYPCTAIDCNRTGSRAFHRVDKRNDHILAGHDAETLFECPQIGCSRVLTRDLMALHSSVFISNENRKCAMPRCSFRVHVGWSDVPMKMNTLLVHLQKKHDTKGRMNYVALLSERGYDARTGTILCPICPPESTHFAEHLAFYRHLVTGHSRGSQSDTLQCLNDSWIISLGLWSLGARDISADVHQHRQVLLSLFPNFEMVVHVWDDIKGCPS
jgi:hypothetical protein